jgi:hypothetical protein
MVVEDRRNVCLDETGARGVVTLFRYSALVFDGIKLTIPAVFKK